MLFSKDFLLFSVAGKFTLWLSLISIVQHSFSFFNIFNFHFCSSLLTLSTDSDIFEVINNVKRWFSTIVFSPEINLTPQYLNLLFFGFQQALPRGTMSVHLSSYLLFHFIREIFVKII